VPDDERPTTPPTTDSDPAAASPPPAAPTHTADARVAPLRGAGVQIDGRRLARVVVGIVLVTLAVLVVVFTIVGVHKNHQIDELRDHSVPVSATVTSCRGLLGGSGSNGAGYSCRVTYVLDGHRYHEPLPGTALYAPGTTIRSVAVPSDPALVSPVSIVDSEHTSTSVFILPAVLFVLLVAILVVLLQRRRKSADADAPG
jgi:uncharacterized protein DUF3592